MEGRAVSLLAHGKAQIKEPVKSAAQRRWLVVSALVCALAAACAAQAAEPAPRVLLVVEEELNSTHALTEVQRRLTVLSDGKMELEVERKPYMSEKAQRSTRTVTLLATELKRLRAVLDDAELRRMRDYRTPWAAVMDVKENATVRVVREAGEQRLWVDAHIERGSVPSAVRRLMCQVEELKERFGIEPVKGSIIYPDGHQEQGVVRSWCAMGLKTLCERAPGAHAVLEAHEAEYRPGSDVDRQLAVFADGTVEFSEQQNYSSGAVRPLGSRRCGRLEAAELARLAALLASAELASARGDGGVNIMPGQKRRGFEINIVRAAGVQRLAVNTLTPPGGRPQALRALVCELQRLETRLGAARAAMGEPDTWCEEE